MAERANEERRRAAEGQQNPYRRAAELILQARHLVAFTGAGISTSTGLPDYRGDNGIRGKKRKREGGDKALSPVLPSLSTLQPSVTHLILADLVSKGRVKHIISQNIDGLHIKSGVPAAKLTELHGNATYGRCDTCSLIYRSLFPRNGLCSSPECPSHRKSPHSRLTSRTRHNNGRLRRFVIGFDEEIEIGDAMREASKADVALILGTSLRVHPFSALATSSPSALVIINDQATVKRFDEKAERSGVRLYEDCDSALLKIMREVEKDRSYQPPACVAVEKDENEGRDEERERGVKEDAKEETVSSFDEMELAWEEQGYASSVLLDLLAGKK